MSKKSTPLPIVGIKYAAVEAVCSYLNGRGTFTGDEILKLCEVAARPGLLWAWGDFSRLYERAPDEVIGALKAARQSLADQEKTACGRIRLFLLKSFLVEIDGELRLIHDIPIKEIADRLSRPVPGRDKRKITEVSVRQERAKLLRLLEFFSRWNDPAVRERAHKGPPKPKAAKRPRRGSGFRRKMVPIDGFPKIPK
jgi:hypothetical protein